MGNERFMLHDEVKRYYIGPRYSNRLQLHIFSRFPISQAKICY